MNNWFKIGLPIMVAVLLIFAAVAVTMTVTAGDRSSRVLAATDNTQGSYSQQLDCSGNCGNCTGNTNCNGNGNCNGNCTGNENGNCSGNCSGKGYNAGTQGSCCDNSNAGVYVPKSTNGGNCCRGR